MRIEFVRCDKNEDKNWSLSWILQTSFYLSFIFFQLRRYGKIVLNWGGQYGDLFFIRIFRFIFRFSLHILTPTKNRSTKWLGNNISCNFTSKKRMEKERLREITDTLVKEALVRSSPSSLPLPLLLFRIWISSLTSFLTVTRDMSTSGREERKDGCGHHGAASLPYNYFFFLFIFVSLTLIELLSINSLLIQMLNGAAASESEGREWVWRSRHS